MREGLRQIRENLYCFQDSCQVYLIQKGDRAVLIDFGTGDVLGALRELGICKAEGVLITHHHRGQAEGLVRVAKAGLDIRDLPCLWYEPIETDRQVGYGAPFQWEGHEITLYPLPGHTRFASAISFQADGERFLCTGDQYAGDGGLMPNYVYKNIFGYDDFSKSAKLYRRLDPDWILSGHWPKKKPDQTFYDMLEKSGREVADLHKSLLPGDGEQNPGHGFPVSLLPYQSCVEEGEAFEAEAWVWQETEEEIRLELILSDGFSCEKPEYTLQKGERQHVFTLYAPSAPARRARIGCRLWDGGRCRGIAISSLPLYAAAFYGKGWATKNRPPLEAVACFCELGQLDLNQRMQESKSCALPLGDGPMQVKKNSRRNQGG